MIDAPQAWPPATRAAPAGWRRARRAAAFTLLEILLALALLGLISAALVSGAIHLLNGGAKTPEEVFWDASAAAREAALKKDQDVLLRFDDKEKAFVLDKGGSTEKFPVVPEPNLTIDFLHAASTGGMVLIGGELVDTQSVPFVTFYSDGTCSPFRVQFRTTGPARVITIDPWTCARVLAPAETP